MTERKAEILKFLNQGHYVASPTSVEIQPVPRDKDLLLSFGQQGIWFIDQLEGASAAYNQLFGIHLKGSLNTAVLEQALIEIVRRHEVLRTSFKNEDGQAVLEIASNPNFTLSVVDLMDLAETKQWETIHQSSIAESQHSFNLSEGSLLRVTLFKIAETKHVLLFAIHHTISDAWSSKIIIQELGTLYEAFSKNQPSPLKDLSIQYADFANWQQQWVRGSVFEEQLTYWKQKLGGHLPVLQLPSDRPRPPVQTFRGATTTLKIGTDVTEKLKKLSQQEGTTLFMTLLAAFKTLLYRYTYQEDICVGTTIANRHSRDLEKLIGYFVNSLVLRTDLSGNPSFRELLRRVRQVAWEAYNYQDIPFELLVAQLQPKRDLSHTPLFQVLFVLENAPREELKLPGLTLSFLEMPTATAKFDLTLSIKETEEGLRANFEYSTDLFDAATIERMAGHLQTLLSAIAVNQDHRLWELPLLTETERSQLLVEWNDTLNEYPQNVCIHQIFEAQVEQTPDSVAVVFEDQKLSYRELNTRANQLAHHLQKLGVSPETLIGICVERSPDMLVGLLGILKAGGAYVPLDPAYPQQRLAFMLADSQISVLLTQKKLVTVLPEHQAQVVCLDADWEEIAKQSDRNPINRANGENLAYIIYTSGSTGQPKGVQIPHNALTNFLSAMRRNPGLTKEDTFLSVTTLSFDIAALELYLPAIVGARLVIVSREVATDGSQLLEQLISSNATVMQATPTTWRMLIAAGWTGSQQLKILCGGEALDQILANQLLERSTELWNLYGPTETTIWSAVKKVENNTRIEHTNNIVSIGRPIANTEFYILDTYLQPVPVGVPGELHIGGVGLARGYFNQPKLTFEKFIPNPFNNNPKSRLYKTGDLVCYQSDGTIKYISRIDHQVKLRGFRIELGEIEALINQYPAAQESVVVVRSDEPERERLVAYVVSQPKQTVTITELRRFLESNLPNYMVPTAFMMLEALPLTPNGKIDRRSLPAPDTSRPELDKAFVLPRTPVEAKLAQLWAEFLGIEQVGIYDNFFKLGGDSIVAIQIIAKANQASLKLTTKQLFQHQTIAQLASVAVLKQEIPAAQETITSVQALLSSKDHCQSSEAKGFTTSDFPEAHLSQKELDRFLAKLNQKKQ
ncbi:amino acid adenylation domain-containing protein [Tolypothrix bouteillei VB521301]|uniref:Amino acid adenylation domain-containing protein n=1 Tax=Tolypothrix bouteillei VB521301 TaxID=1479485 RepID=A0A8S9TF05_9CYAN|nr:amino acid adenylation domain-containing protein [Tolypothrix bouteillei VB521301]